MALDIESLLAPISPDSPCGEDLSYDPVYLELERLAQGTPEQQIGEKIVEAQEPNWREVRDLCLDLLKRGRDLRVVMHLALALLRMEGVPGLRDGLAVLRGVVERYWEPVYPRLDPDDNNDPLERMNIVASLSPPPETFQEPMKFRQRLMQAPLCRSRQLGSFALRDIMVARGELAPAGPADQKQPDLAMIEGAFKDTDPAELQATATATREALDHLDAIDTLVTQYVGAGRAPNLDEFRKILQSIAVAVNDFLVRRGLGQAGPAAAEAPGASAAQPAQAIAGEIQSPEDVVRVLDKICEYYQRSEPSSPVPLLVKRARKLVRKGFVEIIRDLSPEAMRQIEIISGPPEEPPP